MAPPLSFSYNTPLLPDEGFCTDGRHLHVVVEDATRPSQLTGLAGTTFRHWFVHDEDRIDCTVVDNVQRQHPLGISPSTSPGVDLKMLSLVVAALHAESIRDRLHTHLIVWADDEPWRIWNDAEGGSRHLLGGVIGLNGLLKDKVGVPVVVRRKSTIPLSSAGITTLSHPFIDQDAVLPPFDIPTVLLEIAATPSKLYGYPKAIGLTSA